MLPMALLVVGCITVGPDYVAPEPDVPDAWANAATAGLDSGESNVHLWWTTMDDPLLNHLIQRARENNLDLRIAFARILEARALRGVATGERYPDVDGTGFLSRDRASESLFPNTAGLPRTDTTGGLGVDASWEIDFWGRIRRSIEASDAALEASVEDYRDVLVLLFSEVASVYTDVRIAQKRIRFAEGNAESQLGSVELTRTRYDAGIAPQLDVRQAELNLASTNSVIPALESSMMLSIHRLSVLLGEPPATLYGLLLESEPLPPISEEIALGIPADVVRQRPDVRSAERDVAAESARVGIATADLYPRFSLSGTFGFSASNDLFDSGNRVWGLGPSFRWNLFDGGRVRGQILAQEARLEQAVARYEQTVLFALEEVENAVVSYVKEIERRQDLQDAVLAAEQSVELVNVLYRTGVTDFQNVLDAERTLFLRQDDLAASQGLVVRNYISVYRALGGGWDPAPIALDEEVADQENGEPIF